MVALLVIYFRYILFFFETCELHYTYVKKLFFLQQKNLYILLDCPFFVRMVPYRFKNHPDYCLNNGVQILTEC